MKLYYFEQGEHTVLIMQKQPPEMFYKNAVPNNFAIFNGKHLCWSLFLIKLQAFRHATLLKKGTGVFL